MKSYIICLSQIPSSLRSAQRLQKQLSEFDMPNELFEGTYGNVAIEEYHKSNRRCHPWGFKGPGQLYREEDRDDMFRPGLIGCFDSHYRLWQKCAELNEPIIIFEDDAVLVRPYQPIEWDDVLSLVSSHTKKMGRYMHYLVDPQGPPKAEDYGQSSMPGNAGYAIKPHAAKRLVDEYCHSFLPADNAINQHLVRIQIHNYMIGKAEPRDETDGKSSLVRTRFWDKKET
jgi:glycosyl transferase family 25